MVFKLLQSKSGEGYVDVIIFIMSAMLVIALAVNVLPVFIAKHQLDFFANELCRTRMEEIAVNVALLNVITPMGLEFKRNGETMV